MGIAENIAAIRARVERAAVRAGRDPREVTLMAVSKTIPAERVAAAFAAGVADFGENKAQEIVAKYPTLPGARWHMIGHLQTNKVKAVVGRADMIHSVDSERLAREISVRASQSGITARILIEVNIAEERSKFGVPPADTVEFAELCASLPSVELCGLMCVAPDTADPENNREYFVKMRNIFIDIRGKKLDNGNMRHLSMGMSGDFEVAVECGSTIVRVGSAIFGARQYIK
jgi:pyridoxal phosphate enzyme (YggS family)